MLNPRQDGAAFATYSFNVSSIPDAYQPLSSLLSVENTLLSEVGRPHIQKSPWTATPQISQAISDNLFGI